MEKHITAARNGGITDDESKSVLDLTLCIKGKGASHVNRIAERIGKDVSPVEKTEDTGGCGCDDGSEAATTESEKETAVKTAEVEEDNCGCSETC